MYDDLNNNDNLNRMTGNGPTDENPQYRYTKEINRMNMDHIPDEPKKKKRGTVGGFFKKLFICVFFGLLFGAFVGAGIYGVNYIIDRVDQARIEDEDEEEAVADIEIPETSEEVFEEEEEITQLPQQSEVTVPEVRIMDASEVAENCMPSIVAITNMYTETFQSFWGPAQEYQNEASGSGIIVGQNDEELLIVTNSHVISDADKLTVQFIDSASVEAEIKGSKADQDIAIIAVKLQELSAETLDSIKVATLGDSNSLKVGEPAIAIGNALGYGQSVTVGVISAVDREFTVDGVTKSMLQTDAAINPGNSGGALFNTKGELIGINEAKYSSTSVEGVGYAIPISTAKPIIDDLVTKPTRTKVDEGESSYLGIAGVDVTDQVSAMYGMPVGVYVASVTEGSAAEKYGLVKGDIITEFDGESISGMMELKKVMEFYAAGTEVQIKIQRVGQDGYEEMTIPVTLGKKTS